MRLLLVLLATIVAFVSSAQKPFEGTITYTAKSKGEKDSMRLTILFYPNKLRVEFDEHKKDSEGSFTLIDLDSGKIFTVSTAKKNYYTRKLTAQHPMPEVPITKTILGYVTEGRPIMGNSWGGIFGRMANQSVLYTANDLHFSVPEKWIGNAELAIVRDNKIVLGADVFMGPDVNINDGAADTNSDAPPMEPYVTLVATNIKWSKLSIADLTIPTGYLPRNEYDYSRGTDSLDSIAIATMPMMDSSAVEAVPETKPKKIPSPKKKPAAKSPALRRKS